MWRGPPEPSTGSVPTTSGVPQVQPNSPPAPAEGSIVPGAPKLTQLKKLKNSRRNWGSNSHFSFQSLVIEKSTLWYPGRRKMFRLALPIVP